jgi:hypothetical protein
VWCCRGVAMVSASPPISTRWTCGDARRRLAGRPWLG